MYNDQRKCVYPVFPLVSENQRMHDSYKRLRVAARELRGWNSQAELARGLTREGYTVSDAVLNNWRTRGISLEGRLKASLVIGCRPHWIEDGSGEMREYGGLNAPFPDVSEDESKIAIEGLQNTSPGPDIHEKRIPVISWVQAGTFCSSPDLFQPGDAEDWKPSHKGHGPHTYILRVRGDSMVSPYPGQRSYPDGTLIYVDPDKPLTNKCRVVARIHDAEEATFKEYVEDAGVRYLKPLNPQYPTIKMDETMHICGVVVLATMEE